jgi:hypothetical protein
MKPRLELLQLHLIDADIRTEPSTLLTTDYARSPNIITAKRSAPVFTSANSGSSARAIKKTKKPTMARRLTSATSQSDKRLGDDGMQDFIVDTTEAESTNRRVARPADGQQQPRRWPRGWPRDRRVARSAAGQRRPRDRPPQSRPSQRRQEEEAQTLPCMRQSRPRPGVLLVQRSRPCSLPTPALMPPLCLYHRCY